MKKVFKRILSYSKPYLPYLISAIISALIGTLLSLFTPVFIGDAVDLIVGKENVDFVGLRKIAIIITITILISIVFQWIAGVSSSHLAFKTARDIRCELFEKLNEVPLKFIDGNSRGDLISRAVNDIEILSDGLVQIFTQFFTGIVAILGTLGFMLTINFKITIVVVLITPLSLLVAAKITKASHNAYKKQSELRGDAGGYIEEMIGNQKIVKAFSYEKRAEESFDKINKDLCEIGVKATFYSSTTNPSTRFVNGLIYVSVGVAGALAAINGKLFIGQLSSFLTYSNQYTKPFNEISGVVAELQNAIASAERVFNIIDEPSESSDKNLPNLVDCNGNIELKNVSFSYVPEKKLIKNFNLNVKAGQRIAIVGPTGCGKTTIINLLLRFYDIDNGEIKISGQNINKITRNSLRSTYGMVLQDTWLFSGTIAENIAYGRIEATREEIIAAAKATHAHGFIKRLPQGYDTIINEDGGSLSQGQKQLISIARIMLTNPPVLILDEATSSIDIRTEQRIQRAFEKLMKNKTSFIIAHRLSTIRNADMILVMNNGDIIEQGNHEELISKNGFYANLYNSQFET